MAKSRKAKKEALKDLNPKGRAKQVKGGRSHLRRDVSRVGRNARDIVSEAGDAVNATGRTFNRILNPR